MVHQYLLTLLYISDKTYMPYKVGPKKLKDTGGMPYVSMSRTLYGMNALQTLEPRYERSLKELILNILKQSFLAYKL